MDDLTRFCCLNLRCPDHGLRGGENLSVCRRYGKDHAIRFLRCRSCGDRFSERKGTPLFHSHLTREKAVAVLDHLAEGCGVRQTERLVGVHRDTVTRLTRKAGEHAKAAHDELVALIRPMTTAGTTGTTSPWTPSIAWSWRSCPVLVTSRRPRHW